MTGEETLALPTPDTFPSFPYDPPYAIQLDLMRHLYASIEARKVAILESPTGTVRFLLEILCKEHSELTSFAPGRVKRLVCYAVL